MKHIALAEMLIVRVVFYFGMALSKPFSLTDELSMQHLYIYILSISLDFSVYQYFIDIIRCLF